MPDDAGITANFYKAYLSLLETYPDEVRKASESKEASSLEQANVRLAVALGERMDALARDPNWKGVDEMNDPASPFNLANLKQGITNQAREFCYQFDANGQLVTWAKGERGRVRTYSLPGMLRGGVDVHNHPTEEGDSDGGRPFGWTFSDADFVSYNRSGVAVGLVYSREGEYRLDFTPEYSQKSRISIETEMYDFNSRIRAVQMAASNVLSIAIRINKGIKVKQLHEAVSKMAGMMMLAETEKTAKNLGAKFTFTPNKGYEDWKPLPVDLRDTKSQSEAFKAAMVPSPEHKVNNGRKPPHLTTFTAPPVVTARGYTIGEAKDVKAPRKPRKPREPKAEPTQSTQPNNNYYRL
jgi:hypothetical protein